METQKILNLLNGSDNENSKFATKKWYVIGSKTSGAYSEDDPIKFLTKSIKSSLCDCSGAYILVTRNITPGCNNTKATFKNCAPFRKCRTEINETFVDEAEHINIAMPMYNLIEYSDNYSDTSGTLWQFKRDEQPKENNENLSDVCTNNSSSFKYKSNLIGTIPNRGRKNGVKIAAPLKYLSNFWRSLEMPLITCKVELSLTWNKNCILSGVADDSTFEITETKLYVPVVTLKTEGNAKLSKLLMEGFKRPVYWNKYNVPPNKNYNANAYIRERLDTSIQGVNRLFVLAYGRETDNATENSHRKYFLPRMKIKNCNIETDGRNFYDQAINNTIKQYDEVRKMSTGQGDDYTNGSLLDFAYFEKGYRLIVVDLSKQKASDADPKAIKHIIFTGQVDDEALLVFYILEKSKEKMLQFSNRTTKVF